MIINAVSEKGKDVEVLICKRKFVDEMYNIYRWTIGVHYARLRSGYWRHQDTNDIVRLATQEEIDRVEAFRLITKVAEELE